MKRILIIGSEGFIGRSIIKNFLPRHNFELWGCDIQSKAEILDADKYMRVASPDISLSNIIAQIAPYACINCSGSANVQLSFQDCIHDFNNNLTIVAEICNAIIFNNLDCRLVNLSSAAIYGNPTELPIRTDAQKNPISPYGVHKLLSEELLRHYHDIFGIKTCSLRIFSAYGVGQKKLFLWDLLSKIHTSLSDEIQLYGTGNETRDYIHTDDLSNQILLAIQNAPFKGESYNVANGSEISIKQLAQLILEKYGSPKKVYFTGNIKIGDPTNWRADITPMLNWGYSQTVSIEDGVQNYVEWFRESG